MQTLLTLRIVSLSTTAMQWAADFSNLGCLPASPILHRGEKYGETKNADDRASCSASNRIKLDLRMNG